MDHYWPLPSSNFPKRANANCILNHDNGRGCYSADEPSANISDSTYSPRLSTDVMANFYPESSAAAAAHNRQHNANCVVGSGNCIPEMHDRSFHMLGCCPYPAMRDVNLPYLITGQQQHPPAGGNWPPPHSQGPSSNCADSRNSSQDRISRNKCEKQRRDKFNYLVSNLAELVPMISKAGKNLDKTTKLRITATFLRVHFFLRTPRFMVESSIEWEDFLANDFNGILLIVTSKGSIVFISHNVEQVFGHIQLELLGRSIYEFIFPGDHSELRRNLSPDGEDPDINESCVNYSAGSRSYSSPNSWDTPTSYEDFEDQRRSFYVRMVHKTPVRSKQAQYELVHVVGNLRIQKKIEKNSNKDADKQKEKINRDKDLLVAILKPCREYRITDLCLLEACKDEYITQHLMDGSIVYSDHRISTVTGYLLGEVRGKSAYNFMHKDDVPIVLIAFRQMLRTNSKFGKSCFRLRNGCGNFIYLRTRGYLEYNSDSEECSSFICVNTLIGKEEGEQEIEEMKKKFSALIQNRNEPGISAIAENLISSSISMPNSPETADPEKLNHAVRILTTNITPERDSSYKEIPDMVELKKAKLISQTLSSPTSCDIKEEPPCAVYGNSSPNSISRVHKKSVCSPTDVPTSIPANKNCGKLIVVTTDQVVSEKLEHLNSSVTTASSSCITAFTVTTSTFCQNRPSVLRTATSVVPANLPTNNNKAVKRPFDDDTNVVSSSSVDNKRTFFNSSALADENIRSKASLQSSQFYLKKPQQHQTVEPYFNFDMSTEQSGKGHNAVVRQYNVVSENLRVQGQNQVTLLNEMGEIVEKIPQNERNYHEQFSKLKECAIRASNIKDHIFQQNHSINEIK